MADELEAPPCKLCGGGMFYEWDRGMFTFHKASGEFLCPEPVEYKPPKKKTYKRKARRRG
jgi:hypothetical protein